MKRSAALLLSCLLGACSALGLDEFDVARCDVMPGETSPCDALNAELPEDACMVYTCSASGVGCELGPRDEDGDGQAAAFACGEGLDCDDRPEDETSAERFTGNEERCDGLDNDCDGYIDEDLSSFEEPSAGASLPDADALSVRYSPRDDDGSVVVSFARARDRIECRGQEVDVSGAEFEGFLIDAGGQVSPLGSLVPDSLCLSASGPGGCCNIVDLAIAKRDDLLLALGVNRQTCGEGQLRVGVARGGDFDLALGSQADGALKYGVDVIEISEQDRSECTRSAGLARSIREPTLGLPSVDTGARSPRALALWLADNDGAPPSAADDPCPPEAPVLVAGLELRVRESDGAPYVDGSFDGRTERIGCASGLAPPRVVAAPASAPAAGYVVAYPRADAVELVFVPSVEDRHRSLVETGLLRGRVAAQGAAGVALAVEPAQGALALAFRTDAGRVEIALLELDAEADEDEAFRVVAQRPVLRESAALTEGPTLAAEATGFAALDVLDAGTEAGFVVGWIEGEHDEAHRFMEVRVAAADLALLGDPVVVAEGALVHPFAASGVPGSGQASHSLHGYVDLMRKKLRGAHARCAQAG